MEKIDINIACNVNGCDKAHIKEQDNGTIDIYFPVAVMNFTKQQIIGLAEEVKKTL